MANNNRKKNRRVPKKNNRGPRRWNRARVSVTRSMNANFAYLSLLRTVISNIPFSDNGAISALFDFTFNLIFKTLAKERYNVGAYAMFGLSPANLLFTSPLLAKEQSTGQFSFPGHPVSMSHLRLKIRNTTKTSERNGRWAAVLIPYREEHDKGHYDNILKDLTFTEVSAMPFSRTTAATKDIQLSYTMRDRVQYCARPREINEEIAMVLIIWDTVEDDMKSKVVNSMFSCEIEMTGGCRPHIIFGPSHRTTYASDIFKLRKITTGKEARVHHEDGRVEHVPMELLDFESMNI